MAKGPVPKDDIMYCENGACRVVIYKTTDATNCPGCGLFGRLKDKPDDDS
jgi:hypothetical protein